jgi:hypothetical protein
MKILGYKINTYTTIVIILVVITFVFMYNNLFIVEGLSSNPEIKTGKRFVPIVIPPPIKQDPALSYAPRDVTAPLGVTIEV